MPKFAQEIRQKIHATSPFEGFDCRPYTLDLQGTGGLPVMQQYFDTQKPRFIVEVGTWKGASAIFWAKCMRENQIDGAVLCVDTWLGGLEHIVESGLKNWDIRHTYKHGYPTMYYQFLANVMLEGVQDYIIPLPSTSTIGAKWLAHHELQPDVVYIDGSHDEDDVYTDVAAYWKMLRLGGAMLGDDWSAYWSGVICGVNRFVREHQLNLQLAPPTWFIQKTLSPEQNMMLQLMRQEQQEPKPQSKST